MKLENDANNNKLSWLFS